MLALAALGPVAGCSSSQPCAGDLVQATFGARTTSFAFRVSINADALDGYYEGQAINRNPDADCTIALYRFAGEAVPDVPPMPTPGEPAPTTLPGGGVLIEQFHLLAARDREYRVSLVGELAGKAVDGDYTEWVVGTMCPDAYLDLRFLINAFVCNEDTVPPEPRIERVW